VDGKSDGTMLIRIHVERETWRTYAPVAVPYRPTILPPKRMAGYHKPHADPNGRLRERKTSHANSVRIRENLRKRRFSGNLAAFPGRAEVEQWRETVQTSLAVPNSCAKRYRSGLEFPARGIPVSSRLKRTF
jgi:hypothetical protein